MKMPLVRTLLAACLAVVIACGCGRDDDSRSTLGFDRAQVPAPDPAKGKPLARCFNEYLYVEPSSSEAVASTNVADRRLGAFIVHPLRQRYMEQHKLEATPAEIEDYVQAMSAAARNLPVDELKLSDEQKAALKAAVENEAVRRQLAPGMVAQWKIDRALYKQYGGTVIFQQANAREPVGANRAFLEDMEEAGVFEIFDAESRVRFWDYYTRKHQFVVPPDKVDYEKPWWLQKQ